MSHELRAPLTSIEGYVEMLSDGEGGPVTARQRQMLEAVDHGAVRLRTLIEDVFTLAKLESGAFSTVMRPVELAAVVSSAVEELSPSAAAAGLALASDCPDGLVVEGDAGQLERVFINLLSNAVKFTPRGGQLRISARRGDGAAVAEVSDTGIGIPQAEQGKLFTRFFRAANATGRSIPGTGLGLAIVATIIASHGGRITVRSREGAGTTFTIRLPLATSQAGPAGSAPGDQRGH